MNRRIGQLKPFWLRCLLLGLLVQHSWAQQEARYPYSTNDDYGDYDEQDRYDNHHPLDPQSNYGYQPSREHHGDVYREDEYTSRERNMHAPYNSREEYPEPRIITPPVPASQDENVYTREQYHDKDEYLRGVTQAPEEPRAREDQPYDRNAYAREESRTPQEPRAREEQPYDRNAYAREESRTPQEPRAREEQPYDRNEYAREENRTPQEPRAHTYSPVPEEPRIILPPTNRVDPYEARQERPDPRTIKPQPPTYPETHHRPAPQEYPTYTDPREIAPQAPVYQQPRLIVPPTENNAPPSVQPNVVREPQPQTSNYNRDRVASQPGTRDSQVISVPRLGSVRGYRDYKIINNRPISAYLGLRYGTVSPGIGRFQPATSPEPNPYSTIDATREPANCPQFPDLKIITEKEARGENVDDCLTLNIYTPAKSGSYPVLVFVHGEMLFDGSAEEGQPDYFLENDVVLVNINYRLAPFGFLSTLTDDMPGNVALSDIQKSLEWVQQNIRSFNGNADQVTLMGQAGGATLIHALSLSGKAQGLFHKLILQSGTALNPYFLDEQPMGTLRSFAHYARCPPSRNIEGFTSCFGNMRTSELLNYFKRYFESNEPRGLAFVSAFKLILGDRLGYLPQHPSSMVANNTVPTIVGVTKDAGAFIMSRFYDQLVDLRTPNISEYINVVLKHTAQPRHYQLWKNWALAHIFTPEDVRNPTVSGLVQKLLELVNLILYRAPVVDSIRYTSRNVSTYLYCFDYRGEYHRFGHLRNPLPFEIDATLSDDNIFLFPYPEEVSHLNSEDKSMARSIVSMWVNFAQYGVPTFEHGVWPNVTSEFGPFLRFTNTRGSPLELDYHFGDGIPVPNLYPEYFTTTTTTTTTTPRPYQPYPQRPNYPQYPNYPPQQPSYPQYPSNYAQNQNQRGQMNTNPHYPNYPVRQ